MNFRNFKDTIIVLFNYCFRNNNLLHVRINSFVRRNKNIISIGKGTSLFDCSFYMSGGGKITIGNNCVLRGMRIYMNTYGNEVFIGNHVTINAGKENPTSFYACNGGSIIIGEDCMFSGGIDVLTTDFHPITNYDGEELNHSSKVVIGNHVWIAMKAILLKNTCLADNIIVGSAAVVSKKITDKNVIVAGNPARILKKDVNWSRD